MRSPPRREFGKPLVNSIYTFGLMVGVSVSDTTLGTLVANLGYDKLVFPAPVFVGDTLRCESEVHRACASPSRGPTPGSSPGPTAASTSAARMVCECTRSALLAEEAGMTLMPPRSWLFVPADSEKKIAKALDSEADAIIFDLEDSVAADRKAAARDILKAAPAARRRAALVGADQPARQRRIIKDDLEVLASADIDGIVLPKAESGADVTQLAHRTGNIPIHAIVTETAASLFGLLELSRLPSRRWRR